MLNLWLRITSEIKVYFEKDNRGFFKINKKRIEL